MAPEGRVVADDSYGLDTDSFMIGSLCGDAQLLNIAHSSRQLDVGSVGLSMPLTQGSQQAMERV